MSSRSSAGTLVIQDKLIRIEESPEQVLQDLEAVRERFEIVPCSCELFGRRVSTEGRQVDGIHHVGFRRPSLPPGLLDDFAQEAARFARRPPSA